ncbi:acetyl-coenzyme A carboxylase carboxyl transferase subunit alpha, chloroplastic [Tanacetum coccineum]
MRSAQVLEAKIINLGGVRKEQQLRLYRVQRNHKKKPKRVCGSVLGVKRWSLGMKVDGGSIESWKTQPGSSIAWDKKAEDAPTWNQGKTTVEKEKQAAVGHSDYIHTDDPTRSHKASRRQQGSTDHKALRRQRGPTDDPTRSKRYLMPAPTMYYTDHHGFPFITFIDTPRAFMDLKSKELGQDAVKDDEEL